MERSPRRRTTANLMALSALDRLYLAGRHGRDWPTICSASWSSPRTDRDQVTLLVPARAAARDSSSARSRPRSKPTARCSNSSRATSRHRRRWSAWSQLPEHELHFADLLEPIYKQRSDFAKLVAPTRSWSRHSVGSGAQDRASAPDRRAVRGRRRRRRRAPSPPTPARSARIRGLNETQTRRAPGAPARPLEGSGQLYRRWPSRSRGQGQRRSELRRRCHARRAASRRTSSATTTPRPRPTSRPQGRRRATWTPPTRSSDLLAHRRLHQPGRLLLRARSRWPTSLARRRSCASSAAQIWEEVLEQPREGHRGLPAGAGRLDETDRPARQPGAPVRPPRALGATSRTSTPSRPSWPPIRREKKQMPLRARPGLRPRAQGSRRAPSRPTQSVLDSIPTTSRPCRRSTACTSDRALVRPALSARAPDRALRLGCRGGVAAPPHRRAVAREAQRLDPRRGGLPRVLEMDPHARAHAAAPSRHDAARGRAHRRRRRCCSPSTSRPAIGTRSPAPTR